MNATQRLSRRLNTAALVLCALGLAGTSMAQNVAINASGAAAAPTALLDVSSLTQGLFIPRMATLPLNPATLPTGLTVFRTGAANVRGLWVVEYGQWMQLTNGNNGWDIYGNYLLDPTNPNPDFIGTTDNKPMYFSTNNTHRMRLDATTGHLGVGWPIAQPAFKERLDIKGAIRQYYVPPPGQEASATNDPGVIRYQTLGTWTGTAPYKYGGNERLAVNSASSVQINAVLGRVQNYPLQYAGHWGNVDGTAMMQSSLSNGWEQPRMNGWRAFENPYTEVINQSWSHFREAVCNPTPTASIIPSGVPTPYVMSNTVSTGAPNPGGNDLITPFLAYAGSPIYMRRQYLFRAEELNMELAQVNGNPNAVNGLCAGQPISQIGFWVNSQAIRTAINANSASVTIRQAPLGLEELNGFDNTPDYYGTMQCGTFPVQWPQLAVGSTNWVTINFPTPFVWDGVNNIIIEVAMRYNNGGPTSIQNNPVGCTQDPLYNVTYGANTVGAFSPLIPFTSPSYSCTNGDLNTATQMPNSMASGTWYGGSSHYRPIVRFFGNVATASAAPTSGVNNASYIYYPGALVVEDTSTVYSTIPWGRWRPNNPVISTYWAYQGKGTISAQYGVYDNSSRLNDHVFDRAFDGRVAPEDAKHFGGDRLLSIDEMEAFTRANRHLPTMKGRKAWNEEGGFSLGDITNQLWATTETHALYVADLHDKLNVIEMLTNDRPITAAEFRVAQQDLGTLTDLTDADKARLLADLRKRVTLTSTSR